MPKRRSLVGTAREAMGDSRKVQEEARATASRATRRAAKNSRRAAPKPTKEPAREASAAVAAPEPIASEPDREPAPSRSSAYEAMLGFASAALKQNLETGARLARCKSPMEIVAAQMAHAAGLTQSFIAASLKLMEAGLPGAPWTPWRARADSQ
jgi:hypothetical protein